jgi:holo-[acyl-carrier protein] synthase
MEIGVDCIEIKRFLQFEKDDHFLSKIFTEKEIDYCRGKKNSCQHYAAHFAGKEAIIKAISHFGIQLSPNQIEILNDATGIPYVNITAEHCGQYMVKISLSHSDEIALAFVIIDK